ncbi:MAG: hypothetical protein R3A13_10650 [Bdellovibrionota bacterium]
MIIWAIISIGLSAGIILGGLKYLKSSVAASVQAERNIIVTEAEGVVEKLKNLSAMHEGFASKKQLESLTSRIKEIQSTLESERTALKGIETKLGGAQKNVEEKEAIQQEIKSAKEEDEIKLAQLLESYESVSTESIELEQKLAASLKNLDAMAEEVGIDPKLKTLLTDLSDVLTNAGSRLRDLLTEYQSVNERIETLKAQHEDLEEEYTRLVEQQLGE